MYEILVKSIHALQNSKYGKGNKKRLTAIQSALKLATPLFDVADNENKEKSDKVNPLISFRNIEQSEQIPKILEEFMNDFELQCLKKKYLCKKLLIVFNYNFKNYQNFGSR